METIRKGDNPLATIDYKNTIMNPKWFMENLLYIVDKRGKLIKFKLNQEQEEMLEYMMFCLNNDMPIRLILLKARQIGATTFFTAFGFWLTTMKRNQVYGIIAHRMDSAESIFEKNKIFYNNLEPAFRPQTTQFSTEGITFDKKNGKGNNSKIIFATVSEDVYRGRTLTYRHESERAFWQPSIQAVDNSLGSTIAYNSGTIVVRESTANGYNFFKDDWDRAVAGISEFKTFFFGWQHHAEYQMAVPKDFKLTREEAKIQERFNVTNEQLMWRRFQIDGQYKGNPAWFAQENPMTPEEAFVAAGSGVFDAETIIEGYNNCKEPIREIDVESYPTFEKIKIWEEPEVIVEQVYAKKTKWSDELQKYEYIDTDLLLEEKKYKTPYTIGADTSGMGADFNQAVVINNITKRMVASYSKKNIGEEFFALILIEMAKLYNDAMIVPEVNFSHEICNYIIKEGYERLLYVTENLARQDNKISGVEYGWKTTTRTKPQMISGLRAKLTSDPTLIPDKDFWYEAEYYIIEDIEKNIMNAASGHRDDKIIATAIAQYASDSFQSKQSYIVVHEEAKTNFITEMMRNKYQKTKVRKGVYKNNA